MVHLSGYQKGANAWDVSGRAGWLEKGQDEWWCEMVRLHGRSIALNHPLHHIAYCE
jgi:hypothetical protein